MSNFLRRLRLINPKTGKKQVAYCIDNYFGGHQYGYFFKVNGKDALLGEKISFENEEFNIFTEDQVNNCNPIVNTPIDDCKQGWEYGFRNKKFNKY